MTPNFNGERDAQIIGTVFDLNIIFIGYKANVSQTNSRK